LITPGGFAAPPDITMAITGTPGANGWYRSNVTVHWQVNGEASSTGCDTVTLVVDTPGTKITCSAKSIEGDETTKSVTVKLDKTAPTVVGTPERPSNASGWYTAPVTVSFSGTDVTSGIASASCTSAHYAGPDNPGAAVAGSCSDVAGNVSGASFPFRYDATAPSLGTVTRTVGNRSIQLAWRPSADTRVVEIVRSPGLRGEGQSVVYRGSATAYRDTGLVVGRKYHYRLGGFDEASNKVEHAVEVVATGALLRPSPAENVSLSAPPTLVWTAVGRATYYNVQLVRGRKVLSAWPTRASFRLRRTWVYRGRRYRLRPGVYRWYVWPGRGRISAGRYGALLGSSTFVVTR
jgi:hypothetical protein